MRHNSARKSWTAALASAFFPCMFSVKAAARAASHFSRSGSITVGSTSRSTYARGV